MANGPTPGEHVPAVGPGVDRALTHADLREQVVDVAVRPARRRHDRHLAGQRAAAADAVDLQQVRRADGADQRLVARDVVVGQPLAQEERAPGGAAPHEHAGHGVGTPVTGSGRSIAGAAQRSRSRTRSTITPDWPR